MESIINESQPRMFHQLCRRLLFSWLHSLRDASVIICDQSDTYQFGDPSSKLVATIEIIDRRMYWRLLSGGSIGLAESWVEGDWQCDDLTALMRVFARNLETLDKLEKRLGWITYPFHKIVHRLNRNSRKGSRTNIAAHYDLGNDLYQLMLDQHMQYSSAIFKQDDWSLDLAQIHKLKTICDQLELKESDHVIEIGTGWGGLSCYAAKHYGCHVTTTTLSKEQYRYAEKMVAEQGLQDRVTLLLKDYRELEGQYDKLMSVEMIEAVGHDYLPGYFTKLDSLLKPNGRMLIQAITINDQNYDQYRNSVDFIQRYIFPGGCLPSIHEIARQLASKTRMTLTRLNDYGLDYAQTIRIWQQRFNAASTRLKQLGYDDDFQRLWNFYFSYCEGGFREATISLVHLEARKQEARRCVTGSGGN